MIMISSSYGINDLKEDLRKMYMKAGAKDEGVAFLFTEGQITKERFLVFINDLLASGEIADLFPPEDVDNIVNLVRAACKGDGIIDTTLNVWNYFINRVRKNLHMCICFSPVGEDFRTRSRKFPALINSTVIDWFHPWPYDALLSVGAKFLEEVEFPSEEVRDAVVRFMPYSFVTVERFSSMIKEQERRNVYTTPKSFLELIALFKAMIGVKAQELEDQKSKYEIGVVKLNDTAEIVAKLEADLKIKSVEVEILKKEALEQAEIVGKEKTIVDAEASKAGKESAICAKIAEDVAADGFSMSEIICSSELSTPSIPGGVGCRAATAAAAAAAALSCSGCDGKSAKACSASTGDTRWDCFTVLLTLCSLACELICCWASCS